MKIKAEILATPLPNDNQDTKALIEIEHVSWSETFILTTPSGKFVMLKKDMLKAAELLEK